MSLRKALERLSAAALARDATMGDPCTLLAAKAELADANRAACAALAAQPAPVPPFDRTTALVLLQAAAKSGDPGAISLAAQLAGAAPCKDCGYVNFKCRCEPAPVPVPLTEGAVDPDCNYMAPMNRVCNKCGRIHRGIAAPPEVP
jgi:hypothetical protein